MASAGVEAATALKVKGNKAFSAHDWPGAVDFYTQAIEKHNSDPSFFCNRAQVGLLPTGCTRPVTDYGQANIKLESYGYAIADASKAIEIDPSYIKVRTIVSRCRMVF